MKRGETIFRDRQVRVQDLFVGDFVAGNHDEFLREVAPLVRSGALKYREDIRQAFENIPACFSEMLRGDNFGKMLVQISADPTL